MRVLLMHPSEDFDPDRELAPESEGLVEDLGLAPLLSAMSGGDKFLATVCKAALLSPLGQPADIAYRQEALADSLAHPEFARGVYSLTSEALEVHKKVVSWGLTPSPESLHYMSVHALELLLGYLERLRAVAEQHGQDMVSPAFSRLCGLILKELDDSYLKRLGGHLDALQLRPGLWMSARLGRANKGTGYVLHRAPEPAKRSRRPRRGPTGHTITIPDGDDARVRDLGELKAKGITVVANTLARCVEHVVSFFRALRSELAFYIGCDNLHACLVAKGEPLCTPQAMPASAQGFSATGLYDPGLSLRVEGRVVGNDIEAGAKTLVLVTGANRGGKTTFLRSLGLAQLMMQSGMFVAANSFKGSVCGRVFTHFRRDEDRSMTGGKLEEELARLSAAVSHISPGCLLLCNEPFASTNEREASDIARQVFVPLAEAGVRVVAVTHLFDLAESLYEEHLGHALFLRAPRQATAQPFRLVEGAPEATAYGEDVYRHIFGELPGALGAEGRYH